MDYKLPNISHHRAQINGTELHYVTAGTQGSPVLLVHGFPETWWTFNKVIPLLSPHHHVIAVDLRGFGDSYNGLEGEYDSRMAANDLHLLISHLGLGPVHLTGQDISGTTTFRLAATHPESVLSFTAIEAGLPGYGLERLADVSQGGAWHIGVLATPGIPEMLLSGREREYLSQHAFPSLCATPGAITEQDIDEFTRSYSRPHGFRGASGLYRSMLKEGEEIKALGYLKVPVMAVGGGGGQFTANTLKNVASEVREVLLEGVGHYVALEAPSKLADALLSFFSSVDKSSTLLKNNIK